MNEDQRQIIIKKVAEEAKRRVEMKENKRIGRVENESKSHNTSYIKRQAKSIKKEKGITYLQALDQSAIACGFNDWKHFLSLQNGLEIK